MKIVENSPLILIADDDLTFVSTLQELLEAEGFQICVAHEGVRAIQAAHKNKPNLILLDYHMPAGTGESVLKALRSKVETRLIPVILLSGKVSKKDLQDLTPHLAQVAFSKPFNPSELLLAVKTLISPV